MAYVKQHFQKKFWKCLPYNNNLIEKGPTFKKRPELKPSILCIYIYINTMYYFRFDWAQIEGRISITFSSKDYGQYYSQNTLTKRERGERELGEMMRGKEDEC